MRTAFVTGITGQTGSYLAEGLVGDGWNVVGLARPGDGLARDLLSRTPAVTLVAGDLADADGLRTVVAEVAPDAIFNLGGLTSVAQSWKEPALTASVTGFSAATLMDAALDLQNSTGKPVRFVQASSAEMFGSPTEAPQNESTPVDATSPYGAAKAYAHFLVGAYRELGLGASSCILYNHESPRRPPTFVTRKITQGVARIAAGKQDDLVLGSLDARRDWGWAPDYARAMQLIAAAEADDFIIATGEAHSVEDFVAAAFAAAGITDWRPYVKQDAAFTRPKDATEFIGDSGKLRKTLGWSPTKTFEEIVAAMVLADLGIESDDSQNPRSNA
jgi:GDPmannose 4,6-dehydratase